MPVLGLGPSLLQVVAVIGVEEGEDPCSGTVQQPVGGNEALSDDQLR
jgi:hypothetical protein